MKALYECASSFKALMNNPTGLKNVSNFPGAYRELILILIPPTSGYDFFISIYMYINVFICVFINFHIYYKNFVIKCVKIPLGIY